MATDHLNSPLGQATARRTGAGAIGAMLAQLKRLQVVPVALGLVIAGLVIFTVVLNLAPDAPRGEPVLRLALTGAGEAPANAAPGVQAGPEAEPLVLRETLDLDGGSPAMAESGPVTGDTIVIRRNEAPERVAGLSKPLPALMHTSTVGPLPVIGADGLMPMQAYARPAAVDTTDGAPARIALIIGGLGLNANLTAEALRVLPPEVTLAFAPYGRNLEHWSDEARAQGHEYLLQVPMEPFDYPDNDPGPHTLLTSLRAGENIQRLRWIMGRLTGYAGLINFMGAKFTTSEPHTLAVLKEAQERGLMFVDDGSSPRSLAPGLASSIGHASMMVDLTIDADPRPEAIGQALARLEEIAQERGHAVGTASILPITLSSLSTWAEQLENRGIVLVPATSIVLPDGRAGL